MGILSLGGKLLPFFGKYAAKYAPQFGSTGATVAKSVGVALLAKEVLDILPRKKRKRKTRKRAKKRKRKVRRR